MTVKLCAAQERHVCLGEPMGGHRLCDEHIDWTARRLGLPPLRLLRGQGSPPDFDTVLALADRRHRWDGLSADQVRLVKGVQPGRPRQSREWRGSGNG